MKLWLIYAAVTTLFWGVWGALIELPEKAGFPATLGYSVWAFTMLPCAAVALHMAKWKLEYDRRSVALGAATGFLGAGGQLILFEALRTGPAYLVFPIVSLYPVLTVLLSVVILRERAGRRAWTGIVLALAAIPLLSWQPPSQSAASGGWGLLAALVFAAWGVQAYVMKWANASMRAESIFFYMAITAVVLAPIAVAMTDFGRPINWGLRGPWAAALIQVLNSIGALCLVYALRYGKAIIVVPMTALAPVLTIVLSLALYRVVPHTVLIAGMAMASAAIYLMAE
ncbi:MAG: DMT family transporter [Bryobacteraceae bacterium]